jgi:sRNA-binding regulator protein Hfq
LPVSAFILFRDVAVRVFGAGGFVLQAVIKNFDKHVGLDEALPP